MFLVVLLFLVILFYPHKEHFADIKSVKRLQKDFDEIFEDSKSSIMTDSDSYMNLYKELIKVK